MSKLFAREVTVEVLALLTPADSGVASQRQAEELQRHGFIAVWSVERGEQLERLGAVIACTRTDGALWPYARAARRDGRARWALRSDVELLEGLIRSISIASNGGVEIEQALLQRLSGVDKLAPEQLAAIEAVARLGGAGAVLRALETL